jgi:hypothetical protein
MPTLHFVAYEAGYLLWGGYRVDIACEVGDVLSFVRGITITKAVFVSVPVRKTCPKRS